MSRDAQQKPEPKSSHKNPRSRLLVIFMTVFIDLVGFGIIIPLSPYLAREFRASPLEVGLLLSVYSVAQFLFSPIWGALSDRIGRRPVILIGLAGGALSYLVFAFSTSLPLLFVARALAGLFGGNISTAHAYIADVTTPENRSKGMGMIGAAFGLGFIFGPLIGAGLGIVGQHLGSTPPLGLSFSALGAAVLCLANFLLATFVLEESLPPEARAVRVRRNRIAEITKHLSEPVVGSLMIVFFLSGLAMAQMEAMLFPYVADRFGWGLETASMGFAYVGVLMVLTQGYLIRKWMPRFGERRVLTWGLGAFALSLVLIPFSFNIWLLAATMTLLALGNGMMRPPNLGLISLATPASEQGAVLGVTNSLSSLGRILGPVIGGYLYGVSSGGPFWSAGLLAFLALVMVMRSRAGAGAKTTT
jgi:DHA1 family tetracycline resistance protein-like MFS transporter